MHWIKGCEALLGGILLWGVGVGVREGPGVAATATVVTARRSATTATNQHDMTRSNGFERETCGRLYSWDK